jgi:hypothetical protein
MRGAFHLQPDFTYLRSDLRGITAYLVVISRTSGTASLTGPAICGILRQLCRQVKRDNLR